MLQPILIKCFSVYCMTVFVTRKYFNEQLQAVQFFVVSSSFPCRCQDCTFNQAMPTLFQILLAIHDHLFILFDSVMHMFDVASLINSGFIHTLSFHNVVCTVHGCPVIVYKLVLQYAHTYIVNLYLHSDVFCWRPPKRQNIA